jgi:hypothetical protein
MCHICDVLRSSSYPGGASYECDTCSRALSSLLTWSVSCSSLSLISDAPSVSSLPTANAGLPEKLDCVALGVDVVTVLEKVAPVVVPVRNALISDKTRSRSERSTSWDTTLPAIFSPERLTEGRVGTCPGPTPKFPKASLLLALERSGDGDPSSDSLVLKTKGDIEGSDSVRLGTKGL